MSASLKTILLLVAFACLINAQHHDESTCNHDQHQELNPPEFLDVQEDFSSLDSGRVLASTDYPQFRIYANFENLASTGASSSYVSYVQNDLVPPVIAYFQSTLRVKYPVTGGNLVISSSVKSLCSLPTPSALKSGVAADYVILYSSRSESGNILATSYNCQVASGTKRPLVGNTNINRQGIKEANGDAIVHEKNTYLIMHELMHTLGFSKSLFKYFVDTNGKTLSGHVKSAKIGGSTHTVIDVPSLTEKLRNFHGCSSLPGAIMGLNGDDSHWSKKHYLYETMQSGAISGKRISEFGLGLLEASGWYTVNYENAEPYFYGQGQGCDFFNGACSGSKVAFDEFCSGSSRGCNFMGNSGASCSSGSNMENCDYYIPSSSHECDDPTSSGKLSVETYGRDAGSKCFTGTLSTSKSSSVNSYCFKYNCVGDGMNTQLEVILGNNKAVCTKEGTATVDGYYGTVNCPDPLTFCSTVGKQYCPRACMGRGTCVNNKCQCNSGFKGIDCAFRA